MTETPIMLITYRPVPAQRLEPLRPSAMGRREPGESSLAGSSHRVTSFVKSGLVDPPHLFLGLDRICPTLPFTIPRMKTANQIMQVVQIQPQFNQFTIPIHQANPRSPNEVLPINHAIQIKAAEYWLKLSEADHALRELEALPSRSWKCGWALKTRIAAIGMLRERSEVTVEE